MCFVFLIVCVLFVSWFLYFLLFATVSAQTREELESDIAKYNKQIEELDKEIAQYERELTEIGTQKQTLQSIVDGLDLQRRQLQVKIRSTRSKIGTLELEIERLDENIGNKEVLIGHGMEALGETIRSIDRADRQSFVETVLGGGTVTSLWDAVETVQKVQLAVRENITALMRAKESLAENRTVSEKKHSELSAERRTLSSQEQSLAITAREQKNLLDDTKSQESAYQATVEQKQAEIVAFEAALFELASALEYTFDPSRIPPPGKGILRWPLDNVFVTQEFGKTSSSGRLYVSGTHDGVDFRTKTSSNPSGIGTPIKAALSGIVLEVNHGAVPYCQYGKWILIRHSNNLTTLYAHLSDIAVKKDSTVATGEIIGYSGNSGYATGPHLHFTVYASDALSFRDHKCNSGKTVAIPIAAPTGYLNPLDYLN